MFKLITLKKIYLNVNSIYIGNKFDRIIVKNEKEIKRKWESSDSHLNPLNEERTLPMNNHDKNTIIKARLLLLKEGENVKNNRSK